MQQAELNPEQRLAVETTEGAVCVIAGPGAGKTRTLTSRYVYLVRDLGINPQNILCVTFTNKAAQEMKARIRAMTGDLDLGQICTFHAFCVRFLKDEGYVIGIPKDFIVIDEEDELELLNEVYETFGIPGNLMKFSAAMDVIGNFKDDSNYIRDLVLTSPESLREKALQSPDISDKVFYGYLWAERKIFGLDFDDVIWAAQRSLYCFHIFLCHALPPDQSPLLFPHGFLTRILLRAGTRVKRIPARSTHSMPQNSTILFFIYWLSLALSRFLWLFLVLSAFLWLTLILFVFSGSLCSLLLFSAFLYSFFRNSGFVHHMVQPL